MLTRRPTRYAQRLLLPARIAGAVLSALALGGCAAPGPSRAPDATTVVAMSEEEFDAFAGHIAEQLRRVAADGRYRTPVGIAYPEVVAAPDLRPAARALAERLSEGLNDRLAGAALVTDGRAPPAWQSRLELRRDPAGADAQQLEFAVIDNRAGVEIARERTTFAPRPLALRASEPPIELGRVPRESEPAPPPSAATPRAVEPAPRPRSAEPAPTAPPPTTPTAAAPPARPSAAAPPAPRTAPRSSAPRPATPPRTEPRRAEPPPDVEPAAPPPVRPREERGNDERERARRLRLNGNPRELAATVARRLPRYESLTAAGQAGEVVFLDDDAREAFRLISQGAGRGADGRLRVELELRAHDDRQDAELRVIFLDADGQVVDATPVIPYRLVSTYTSTVVVPAADPRAERYIVLIRED